MPDSTKEVGAPDRIRINVNESWELDYWTKKFNISADQLKAAVTKVGPMVEDVQREFKGGGKR